MKKSAPLFALALAAALALPALAAESKTFKDVAMVDVNCSSKVASNPDAHTRSCALKCASSGFGILTEGKYVKFDAAGNEKAVAALKASSKSDHLRVNVTGQMDGETLKVETLTLVE